MSTPSHEAAARRRYLTVTLLFWLPIGLATAPLVLLFTARGLGLGAVAGLFAVHSLTTAALELPTGGLSDVIGRRPVLAAAGVLDLVAFTLLALGEAYGVLLLGMALMGAGRALASGPAEAWYVDTVRAQAGPEADLRPGLARGSATGSLALAAGTLLGGALPWLLSVLDVQDALDALNSMGSMGSLGGATVLPLSVPPLIAAAVELAYVVQVWAALAEPERPPAALRTVFRSVPATVLTGLRLGRRDAVVRRVLLTAAATGVGLGAVELLTPGRAAELTGAAESGAGVVGLLSCAGFLCAALGARLAPGAAGRSDGSRAVLLGLAACTAGVLLLAVTARTAGPAAAAAAAFGYGLSYLGLGTAGPNQKAQLHQRVPTETRATALSVQSLALQLCGALSGLALALLPPGPPRWLLAATALAAAALLWTGRHSAGRPGNGISPRPPPARTTHPYSQSRRLKIR
ncbi:MFS transporter [Kitasatospora sp. NPDC002551]|uniref:MFS transporter n=1 Tax=Kitasatospora sp. NPDC002551 TaxID=3154539 RepID=UPI0033259B11